MISDDEQLSMVRKEIGMESPLFLQRLLFAEWIAAGTTLEAMERLYGLLPSVQVPSARTLERWRKQWVAGSFSVKDGRAGSVKVRQGIRSTVLDAFRRSPRKSAKQIAWRTGLARKTVCHHLKQAGLHYGAYIKVPYKLTRDMRNKRVEVARRMLAILREAESSNFSNILTMDETPIQFENESDKGWYRTDKPKTRVEAQSLRKKKFTLTVVWGTCGIVCVKGLERPKTVNTEYFCNEILATCKEWCERRRRRQGVESFLFHMDNARPHTSNQTKQYMTDNNMIRMEHPAYSPDLAPCDYFLFGHLKDHFADAVFEDAADAVRQISAWLHSISQRDRIAAFQEWMRRLQRCIDVDGDYVFISDRDRLGAVSGERDGTGPRNE